MIFSSMNPGRMVAAYLLDLVLGDPQGWPHPVRWMGNAISAGERWIRRRVATPAGEVFGGGALAASLIGGSYLCTRLVIVALSRVHDRLGLLAEIILAWTVLATRSLLVEAGAVLKALDARDIEEARRRLSGIVGRDTAFLDEAGIARALIETVAESVCDGIIAPLTHLTLGGVPAGMAYKAINTLDSMVGHPEPPYQSFGRIAARIDDVANFLPARLAAFSIVAAAFIIGQNAGGAWRVWLRDGGKHPSPNAGQCEAAIAGALGVRLGGLNHYDGRPVQRPYLGGQAECRREHARASLRVAGLASLLACSAAVVCCLWMKSKKERVADHDASSHE